MFSKAVFVFVIAVAAVSAAIGADVDCTKRPQFVDPKSCCSVPEFITAELMKKCEEFDLPPPPPPMNDDELDADMPNTVNSTGQQTRRHRPHHHHHPHHPMLIQCVFNETGIFVDNKLDEAKLKEYLTVALKTTPDMIPITEAAFTTCVARNAEMKAIRDKVMAERKAQSGAAKATGATDRMARPRFGRAAGFLMGCVNMETFKNCAPSSWNSTQACDDTREFMKTCKPQGKRLGLRAE